MAPTITFSNPLSAVQIPGIPDTANYVSYEDGSISKIVDLIAKKLGV